MTQLSPFGLTFAAALTKVGFVPSPQVQQQLQAKQAQEAPPQPPVDPAAAGAPSEQGAPPLATLEDVKAGLEQLAQMIQQIPGQVAAAAPVGGEIKKKSPAERMDAIEQQLSQLTGGVQAPAPADPAAAAPSTAAPVA